jgi:prophage regulatory protein
MVSNAPRLLKSREVCEMLGISKSTLHRMVRRGLFPRPLKPSPGTSRWPSREVEDYMASLPRR